MKRKTRKLLEACIWLLLTVLISTCIVVSTKEYNGAPTTNIGANAIWVITTCIVGIFVAGLILVLNTPSKTKGW